MGVVFGALGALVGAAVSGAVALVGIAISSIGSVVLSGIALYGLSALQGALLKTKATQPAAAVGGGSFSGFSPPPQPQDVQQSVSQPVPQRRNHYGRVKAGGFRAWFDSKDGVLYQLLMCAARRVHAFEEHWLNDAQVLLGADLPETLTGDNVPITLTAFGAQTGQTNASYGFNFSAPRAIEYVTVYPMTYSQHPVVSPATAPGFAGHFTQVVFGGGSYDFLGFPYSGNVTFNLYGRAVDTSETLIATLVVANNLAPQFLISTDQATKFYGLRVTAVPGAGFIATQPPGNHSGVSVGGGAPAHVGFSKVEVKTVGLPGAATLDDVVATVSGGALGADPITTASGSKDVVFYHAAHGFTTGQTISVAGLTDDVNGIPFEEFAVQRVLTVLNPDEYRITMGTAATAAGAAGGSGVRWRQHNTGDRNQYVTEGVYRAAISVNSGADDQAAWKKLIDAFPNVWGVYHRLAGIATSLCTFRDVSQDEFSKVYPQGIPNYRAVIAGAPVLDPRNETHDPDDASTWEWSDNAALIILDYLTHVDGMGRPRASFDAASFAAAADVCDESVALASGGTETRYRICTSYDLTERPEAVLTRLLAACDGHLYPTADGRWGLRVGKWYGSGVTIESKDILEYSIEQGADALSKFNYLKLTYTDPLNDYQRTEAQPWEDVANVDAFGRIADQLDLIEVPSHSQARRLGKIVMAKGNPDWRGTIKTTLAGLVAMGEAIVTVKIDELGIDETFTVLRFYLSPDLTYCLIEISSLSAAAYQWNPETEEGTPPPTSGATVPLQVPGKPDGFEVIPAQIAVQGSTFGAAAAASWDVPARDTLSHEIQYKLTADDQWTSAAIPSGTSSWQSSVLSDGASYDFRLRAIGPGGAPSDWTAVQTVIMTADTSPPAAPTGFTSSKAGGAVTLQWTNPTSENFYSTKVYRGTTAVFADAAVVAVLFGGIGDVKTRTTSPPPGTYYWWIKSFNASGIGSSEVGPQTQTLP